MPSGRCTGVRISLVSIHETFDKERVLRHQSARNRSFGLSEANFVRRPPSRFDWCVRDSLSMQELSDSGQYHQGRVIRRRDVGVFRRLVGEAPDIVFVCEPDMTVRYVAVELQNGVPAPAGTRLRRCCAGLR